MMNSSAGAPRASWLAPRRLHRAALDLGEPRGARRSCAAVHRHRPRPLRAAGAAARRDPVIGAAVRRVEDGRFLTGSGRFVADLSFPGELHCALVRSPHAHARCRAIDIAGALGLGVAAVLTGRDMQADGVGPMTARWRVRMPEGPPMAEPPRWALARETVRHVGEPVAAVFAESRLLAEDAAEQVVVDYEILAPVKDEICFTWTRGDRGAVEQAFAQAPRRVEIELVNNRLCGAAIETRGAISTGDTLYCGTQTPHHIRRYV